MRASPEGRWLRPIRLSDIPLRVRQDAYDKLLMTEVSKDGLVVRTLTERIELGVAAERPSSRVYWIPADAYERESAKRAWQYAARRESEDGP